MHEDLNNVAWIDGAPYIVCLPKGSLWGDVKPKKERFWDFVLQVAKENGVDLHNKEIDSWCQEWKDTVYEDEEGMYVEKCAAVRSTECCNNGTAFLRGARLDCIGFRPCLVSVDLDTVTATDGPWAGIQNGEVISIGSLYYGDKVLTVPTDCRKKEGDTPRRLGREAIHIGDTSGEPETEITWMKVGGVLVADRNLMVGISWNDLGEMGYARTAEELKPLVEEAFDIQAILQKIHSQNQKSLDRLISDASGSVCKRLVKGQERFNFVKE